MSSQNDESVLFLLDHGFSSSEIQNMTQKEIIETISVLLDSDESNTTSSNPQKNKNNGLSNKNTKKPNQSKIFDRESENAGLTDDEAFRAALQQSIDYKSEPLNPTANDDSFSNEQPQKPSVTKNIVDFVSNAFQTIRDTVHNAGLSNLNQFNYNDFEFSSDDDLIEHDRHLPTTNNRRNYNPPPPKNDITIPSHNKKDYSSSFPNNGEINTSNKSNKDYISPNKNNNSIPPSYQYNDYLHPSNQYYNNNPSNQYYNNDPPSNQYHSNKPSNQYYNNDPPSNQYHSNKPSNQYYNNDPPSNQYHSNKPSNQYNNNNPPSNQYSNYQQKPINNNLNDFDDSKYLIQQQNEQIKRLEEEMNLKEQQEKEKKLIEEEENNIQEACKVSLADEIIDLLEQLPPEPPEPKTSAEKRNVVAIKIMMDDGKSLIRRFNVSDKGKYVYAWVAGHTLDSDEKLYMDSFELKMPMGVDQILDKNLTLDEQKLRGKVCFNVSEL